MVLIVSSQKALGGFCPCLRVKSGMTRDSPTTLNMTVDGEAVGMYTVWPILYLDAL